MLRYFVGRIQKGLSLLVARRPAFSYFSEDIAPQRRAKMMLRKEEYGFRQQGVLALSCRPQELQKILDAPKA
ncbi:hypothetical protein JHK82_036249 [Glycine max]|nr:hypothetical protein JHK82_036249 [Glycine max]